jgi:epoxyqueuosine reductase
VPAVESLLHDPAPVVRGAAVWALSRLVPGEAFAQLHAAHQPSEADADVQDEWRSAMLDPQ